MTTENPPSSDMIKESTPSVDLSPEQLTAFFGEGHECTPGETYTIVLKAGDKDESGYQSFTVDKSASEGEDENEGEAENKVEIEFEEPSSSEEEQSAFGYDREKLNARRRRQAPKLSAKDLEMD